MTDSNPWAREGDDASQQWTQQNPYGQSSSDEPSAAGSVEWGNYAAPDQYQPNSQYQPNPQYQSRTSGRAVAVLVLGICGVIPYAGFVTSIVAVSMANSAFREIDDSRGTVSGRGMAKAGLICGCVVLGLYVLFVLAAFLFGFFSALA